MGANNTNNFDVLVQVKESELNDQLKAIFLSCDGGIPRGVNFPPIGYLNFDIPTMELDSDGQVRITLPVSNSQFTLNNEVKQLDGSIVITNYFVIFGLARSATIGLDFQNDAVDVQINIDQLDELHKALFKTMVRNELSSINEYGRIYLTEITLRQYASETFMPSNVKVTTANSPEGRRLTIALQMAYDRTGDISQVNSYLIPNGHSATIIVNSDWLLGYVLLPQLAQALNTPLDHFDKPLQLNQSISIPRKDADDVILTAFEAKVVGQYIRVSGSFKAPLIGPDMEVDFYKDFEFKIDENGKLRPIELETIVDIDYFLASFTENEVKNLINESFKDLTTRSYALGALTDGFDISSVHIDGNLVLSADVISDEAPEDIPLISIQHSWKEAELEDSEWGPIIRIPGSFSQNVKWQGIFEAIDCRAAFPIEYEWSFNGETLEEGENHQINTTNGLLAYHLDNQVLTIKATSVGQRVAGEVCLKAVDGLDRELTDCINFDKGGTASRNDGRLNSRRPDILREWVNPIPIDPMWQGRIDSDLVSKLFAREGVTSMRELRKRLNLTQLQMAERVGLPLADYAQFESGTKQR